MSPRNPCLRCGACCAVFRVSFNCSEVDNCPGGVIPAKLTFKLNETRAAMKGTEVRPYRCQALTGKIGGAVCCSIYDRRPTTCREFLTAGEDRAVNSLCDRARVTYGLMPISGF
jgi:Fe-S-cluster containining protein